MLADKDVVKYQSHYPNTARNTSRRDAILAIRALQISPMVTRFFPYVVPSVSKKEFPPTPGQNEAEIGKELIEDPTKGNLRWYVHRVGGGTTEAARIEDYFGQPGAGTWQNNVAARSTHRNSLNETFATAYFKEWDTRWAIAPDLRPVLSGAFMDVAVSRPTPWYQGEGTVVVTDADLDYDGVADNPVGYGSGAGAGGRMWCEGQLALKAAFEARFPGKYMIPNSPWDHELLDGEGAPPLPLSNHPFYRQWELPMDEVTNNDLGLRIASGGTTYQVQGGSASGYYRGYSVQEKFVKLDANMPTAIGRGAVLMHANGINRTPTQTDIEFVRTLSLMPLLTERGAPCVQLGGSRPFSLDELLVQLGNPLAARSMGTLNETNLAWSFRAANQSVGVARFYWAEFQHGIVVCRLDHPTIGAWPSADALVTCTLPNPGAGKKWQRLNAATYVNPVTQRATRNQSPTLNNGADVTTVALRPLHCVLIRRVNV
jgi:hypothetical protein